MKTDVELTSSEIDTSPPFFAYAGKLFGGGEVTSGFHTTREEAETEALAMAQACWGEINVVREVKR